MREVTTEALWKLSMLQRLHTVTCFMFVPVASMSRLELRRADFRCIVNLLSVALNVLTVILVSTKQCKKSKFCDFFELYFGIINLLLCCK